MERSKVYPDQTIKDNYYNQHSNLNNNLVLQDDRFLF